jgi:hypothetical protein
MTFYSKTILQPTRYYLWAVLLLLSFSYAQATFVQVSQISSPVGYVSQSEAVAPGTAYQTIQPNLTSSGYTFGYWSVGGNRLTDSDGRSVTQGKITINAATTLTAHYFLSTADTDTDGLLDWFEYRNFGNLDQNASSDSDADGFTNGQENGLGQEPTIKDSLQDGGISSRQSSGFVFADSSMVHYLMKSDPIGFITTTEGYVEINASVTSSNLHAATNGYHFAYWSVNGTRQAGPTGTALSQITTKLQNNATIVAHYFLSTLDGDNDSVLDWFELNQFGDLTNGPDDDPDADGFKNSQESELGQEANIKDSVQDGGISSRQSSGFVFADSSMVKYTIKSNPIGFISSSAGYVEINASVSTQTLNGAINGYHFAYWSVNGVRQHGPTGIALSQINPKIENDSNLIAHYFLSTLDTDNDSVMDWFEYNQFGDLSNGPAGDPDADGFTNSQESALGQEANIKDSVQDGGISSRISGDVLFFLQVNNPPSNLQLSSTTVHSGKAAGELVGTLIPTDPDHDPGDTYQISFLDGNGSTDRDKFSISNLNLVTTDPLPIGSYFINLRVSDDENESLDKNFTISSIYDPNKDDDNDGLTYAQEQALGTSDNHADSDGDGFPDLVESNYGSNPTDANSTANAAPTDLNNSAPLSFFENQPIGTVIGDFNATDPDANATLTFSISGPNAPLFSIDQNGTLFTNAIFDFETNPSDYNLLVRVTDQHNAFLEISKNIVLQNTNELPDQISLNGQHFLENQPIGTFIGDFNATSPNANSTFTYSITGSNAHLFNIEPDGSLFTNAIFDFENGPSQYTIKVRVSDEWNASIEKEFTIQILDLDENAPVISLLGESVITLLTTDTWIDPGATWTDQKDGNGTVFSQNDLNQTHPTLEEWIQNGKKLPEGMMFTGGTPWFDESTGQNRDDKEVYDMIFAILPGEYKLSYLYRDQAGNPSNLATRTLLVIHPTKPIVQTLTASIDENGSVQFGAEIRSGAKMELIETGIHYGIDQIFSEFSQIDLSLSTTTDQYFSTPLKPQGNNQIFYRAYARNKAGTSYGSVKTLTLPSESNATAWWSGSIEEQGGWQTSPWFGSFRRYEKGWIFHADLNWLYAYAGESGDVWLWSQNHGWLWTGPDVYPHLFNHGTANWFYFLKKQDGTPRFYDYSTESIK